ncbi:MAG: O-succinylbenzoic acid--CoA ligase [Cyclobacteriaceae bacterium]|jgi:O-succinylbenzoic acid--CoA ligase
MLLTIKGKKLIPASLESGKINEKNYSQFEKRIVEIINSWNNQDKSLSFYTSGSTGSPKLISISREIIKYSVEQTLNKLDPDQQFKESLICINPNYIGGTMAVIRALIGHHNIMITEPDSNPLKNTGASHFDLVSMVPLQIQNILAFNPSLFTNVNTVIIGGAPMNEKDIQLLKKIPKTRFFHSYGMTETASHFALRELKTQTQFETLGDISISTDELNRLKVKGTVTENKWLQTTDLVEITDSKHFIWKGRADHVINSGGVKVSAEEVESVLQNQISVPFFVAGIPDQKLGEKIVLIIESNDKLSHNQLNFEGLDKYAVPKEHILLNAFVYTATGKINRSETLQKINREY